MDKMYNNSVLLLLLLIVMSLINGLESINNFADIPCGMRTQVRRSGKIVGGENAQEGEFPWLVSITRRGAHFCGGSLITKRHVLTAGHCICSGSTFIPSNQMKITLGQYELTQSSPSKYEVSVESVTMHPDYVCRKVRNDIAILKLDRELQWSEFARPACLPTGSGENGYTNFADVLATVAGWGWTNEDTQKGGRADTLQKAKVNILETEKCREWYKSQGKKGKIQETQMCAGYETGGVDSCWADSGGPLMVASGTGDQLMVVGVVSTGIGCARPFLPGLYTRVSEYIPWIQSVVKG